MNDSSTWNTPIAIEIKMDAEIGSYQSDDDDDRWADRATLPACSER